MNENITENEATLDSLLSEDMNIVKIVDEDGKEEYEKINKVEVGSVAEAYCEIVVEKSKKFFPCLSYASKINLSNNKKWVLL